MVASISPHLFRVSKCTCSVLVTSYDDTKSITYCKRRCSSLIPSILWTVGAMALKFYYDDASQPCRAVHVMLDANNIPYEGVYVSLGKGRRFSIVHVGVLRCYRSVHTWWTATRRLDLLSALLRVAAKFRVTEYQCLACVGLAWPSRPSPNTRSGPPPLRPGHLLTGYVARRLLHGKATYIGM